MFIVEKRDSMFCFIFEKIITKQFTFYILLDLFYEVYLKLFEVYQISALRSIEPDEFRSVGTS